LRRFSLVQFLVIMPTASAIATLVVFILSITFVILPVSIPLRPGSKRRFPIDLTTAPIVAIAALWVSKCIGSKVIVNGIVGTEGVKPYNILILFFSLAYMAITLDITGILQAAAFWVSNKGGSNGYKLYFYFYIMFTAISAVIGNDPVILSGTVFLVYYTKAVEVKPLAWLFAEFAVANTASMILFVGNPTNVVICEGFSINNVAYTAYSIFPFFACNIVCLFVLAFQFRDSKYIPRKLNNTSNLDPRSVLLDPVSAWVGSISLITCLVVILVVSFFHIDVWMISLPFALAKFVYDLAWDHYRFKHDMIPQEEDANEKDGHRAASPDEFSRQQLERHASHQPAPAPDPKHFVPTAIRRTQTAKSISTSMPFSESSKMRGNLESLENHFPTFIGALPRLPFALVPFAFSQFILIEALAHQGWIDIFAHWLVHATRGEVYPIIWIVGTLGVVMCNLAGTNIGATILLTKVIRAAPGFSKRAELAGALALVVSSNIGAVSFTFSASLAGLLWRGILHSKEIPMKQRTFARWNVLPVIVMTVFGLAVVCIEMTVLSHS
jgi:Na+/H+ antiporter NhaD/arsenite permease-like protein